MENIEKAPPNRLYCMKVNVVWTADIDQLFTFELTSPELHYGFVCVFVSIVIVSWNEVLPVNNTRKRNIVTLNAYNYNYNAHGYNWLGRCQINCRAAELEGRLNRLAWFECQIIYRAVLEFSPLPTHSYHYIQQTENLEWTMSMST